MSSWQDEPVRRGSWSRFQDGSIPGGTRLPPLRLCHRGGLEATPPRIFPPACSRPRAREGCVRGERSAAAIGCPALAPRWLVVAAARRDWPVQRAGAAALPGHGGCAVLRARWGAAGLPCGAVCWGARPDPFRSSPLLRVPLFPENGCPRWAQQREELLRVRDAGPRCLRLRPPSAVGAGQGRPEGDDGTGDTLGCPEGSSLLCQQSQTCFLT